ncbi:MAG: sigma-70 family RNA polymerase sigma factor [Bryobacterales bacterium]|nr:sigma-70 family RNA polymerase sigma factor [Bryobacterales bacterium]
MPDDHKQAGEITVLLDRWTAGDKLALDRLAELLYPQWRSMAHNFFRQERTGHTLQPTALVHEAYAQLEKMNPRGFDSRRDFQGLMAQLMRRILVSHARGVQAQKRGGGVEKVVDAEVVAPAVQSAAAEFLALDHALEELSAFSARKAQVIELRYFGGLTQEEAGLALGISTATVHREQRMAEAWLSQALQKASENRV